MASLKQQSRSLPPKFRAALIHIVYVIEDWNIFIFACVRKRSERGVASFLVYGAFLLPEYSWEDCCLLDLVSACCANSFLQNRAGGDYYLVGWLGCFFWEDTGCPFSRELRSAVKRGSDSVVHTGYCKKV